MDGKMVQCGCWVRSSVVKLNILNQNPISRLNDQLDGIRYSHTHGKAKCSFTTEFVFLSELFCKSNIIQYEKDLGREQGAHLI